jgi:hypothetical protein
MYEDEMDLKKILGVVDRNDVETLKELLQGEGDDEGIGSIKVEVEKVISGVRRVVGYMATATLYPAVSEKQIAYISEFEGLQKEAQDEMVKRMLMPFTAIGAADVHSWLRPEISKAEVAAARATNHVVRNYIIAAKSRPRGQSLERVVEEKERELGKG